RLPPLFQRPYLKAACKRERARPRRDSALGNHSSDFVDFGTTADPKSSSAPKSTKSTTSNTANLRIFF
ncbi:hypothetical protein F4V45_01370, partial [Helicobacter canis]